MERQDVHEDAAEDEIVEELDIENESDSISVKMN